MAPGTNLNSFKILYHHRTLGDGAEGIHIREIINAFRSLGHRVKVVALTGEDFHSADKNKKQWTFVSRLIPDHLYELAELAYNFVGKRSVLQAMRDFQPDFVFDRYNSYSTGAVYAARQANVPVLLEVNAPVAFERTEYDEKLPLKFPRLAVQYEQRILSSVDHIFAVSTPLKDFLVNERKTPEEKITVLPNGANPDSFNPQLESGAVREKYRLGDDTVIGFVGILRPWHGVDLLLRAFSSLVQDGTKAKLFIVGDGPMQEPLTEQARQLHIGERVVFTGKVPHHAMASHVAAMDIAVSPRATFYASPMKILEYMAIGVPTVAPRMPNIMDIVTDAEDGLLFEEESAEALCGALKTLVSDPDRRRQMGGGGSKKGGNRAQLG